MSFPKILVILTILLFGGIGTLYFMKGEREQEYYSNEVASMAPVEIELEPVEEELPEVKEVVAVVEESIAKPSAVVEIPETDRIAEFFNRREPKFPIVKTITYKSRVPWRKGRPAWLSDYASHFKTSRHFIARSLNGKPDYFKQEVSEGDRFNVFDEDKNFEFYLLVDIKTCKMCFYYLDNDTNERVLVKTYDVGLGRPDDETESGYLTPLGKYTLGNKIAVYRPKTMGFHQGDRIEMIKIFGTRWIPFGEEIEGCTDTARGYGIHGLPLTRNDRGELVENRDGLGGYDSDGCIRLATKDIEELFSIIITSPTTIEIVNGTENAKLPGDEQKHGG